MTSPVPSLVSYSDCAALALRAVVGGGVIATGPAVGL